VKWRISIKEQSEEYEKKDSRETEAARYCHDKNLCSYRANMTQDFLLCNIGTTYPAMPVVIAA
jgi:hypothetical protein